MLISCGSHQQSRGGAPPVAGSVGPLEWYAFLRLALSELDTRPCNDYDTALSCVPCALTPVELLLAGLSDVELSTSEYLFSIIVVRNQTAYFI